MQKSAFSPHFFYFYDIIPYMQESLSNAEYATSQQLEFDFEGYDSEPNSEDSFEKAEALTLQAISSAPAFTDFFEDAKCLTRLYDNTSDDESKGFFYLFRAHDAVTGRNIAVKTTNPAFCEEHPQLNDYLKWESAVLSRLKGKNRIQQICTPLKSIQVPVSCDGKSFMVLVSFFSSIYLPVDIRKSFFDEANDKLKTCANRLRLFCSIISAVQSLHREGLCHRDLKPSNIMGTRHEGKCTAVLIDLGLSLAKPEIEKDLRLFSPKAEVPVMYAAPEIYSGFDSEWELAQCADIYSLGCMLFELFDKRTFYNALIETNGNGYWETANNIRVGEEEFGGDLKKRLDLYHDLLSDFAPSIIIPRISEESILPLYIRKNIQEIIDRLCAFDYRKRTKESELDGIKTKLRHIAHILEDEHLRELYKKRKKTHRTREVSHA